MVSYEQDTKVWDIATAPNSTGFATACDNGFNYYHGDPIYGLRVNKLSADDDTAYKAVGFKGENIVMAGQLTGLVAFVDVRARQGTLRLRHSSAVSAIQVLKNENLVLVNGLRNVSRRSTF